MKHKLKVILLFGVLGGILLAFTYINPYSGTIRFSELILQLSGSRGEFPLGNSLTELLEFSMRMLPGYVFSAFVGTELYRHFCTASVYVFSRYPHRLRWYIKETAIIFLSVLLFQILQIGSAVGVTFYRYEIIFDAAGFGLMIYHLVIHSLWLFLTVLIINFLSIYIGSDSAYTSVTGGQAALIALLAAVKSDGASVIRTINPISHLVIAWHGSGNKLFSGILNTAYTYLDLDGSLLCMALSGAAAVFIGGIIIQKHDLLISNSETEG